MTPKLTINRRLPDIFIVIYSKNDGKVIRFNGVSHIMGDIAIRIFPVAKFRMESRKHAPIYGNGSNRNRKLKAENNWKTENRKNDCIIRMIAVN